jgi:N-acetylmuramoyl-L-alanine amidase
VRASAVGAAPQGRERGGALAGKTVYLSPGHGFYDDPGLGRWATQRPNTHGVVEDLISTETVSHLLGPLLESAGARVVSLREPDPQRHRVTVDEAQPAAYAEAGEAARFSAGAGAGWGTPPEPQTDAVRPFTLGAFRQVDVDAAGEASATWTPDLPAAGAYSVWVTWPAVARAVADAHLVVRHAGGETHFRVDQRRHAGTWVWLGRFHFRAGRDPLRGAVVARSDSQAAGAGGGVVVLDAVRFGGGMGRVDRGRGTSGRPRSEEASRYHAQELGAPPEVWGIAADRTVDVGGRARLAAWDHEEGEDAVYVAWHTNASSNASLRGTTTYVYGPGGANADKRPEAGGVVTGVAGSLELARALHAELVGDARAGWDAAWRDGAVRVNNFGELNPTLNPEMPAVLLEVAFHDAAADAAALREPDFRLLAARAIQQGLIRYFAARDGRAAVLPPEPPVALLARNVPGQPGRVEVRWRPAPVDGPGGLAGDAADGWRVQQSEDGLAWDDGTAVPAPPFLAEVPAGRARYFRVTATNAGGESLPSDVVGAGVPAAGSGGPVPALVVNGFDRLEGAQGRDEPLLCFALGEVRRLPLDRMNDGSYARRHGEALLERGLAFDSAGRAALLAGDLSPAGYTLLDWMVGRGARGGEALSPGERALLRAYVAGGGALLLSGTNVASQLTAAGAEGQAFLAEVLQARLAGPGVRVRRVDGADGTALEGLRGLMLDDGERGAYGVGLPDVLAPLPGAALWARFERTGGGAAVRAGGGQRVALLGFPLEALVSGDSRRALLGRVLADLGVQPALGPVASVDPEPAFDPAAPVLEACAVPPPVAVGVPPPAEGPDMLDDAADGGCGCQSGGGAWPMAAALVLWIVQRGRSRTRPQAGR